MDTGSLRGAEIWLLSEVIARLVVGAITVLPLLQTYPFLVLRIAYAHCDGEGRGFACSHIW